jgi:pyruvate, water dikinase
MTATSELQQVTRTLASLRLSDVPIAGGKGANLGELIGAGFPVPPGFVVTAGAFLDAMATAGIRERLADSVRLAVTAEPAEIERLSRDARDAIAAAGVPNELAREILIAHQALNGDRLLAPVAVRSSATAEDTADTSFAGMNVSFTNVGAAQLVDRVLDCWVSLYGDRVMAYRAERGLTDEPAIAVVVQEMRPSERAGVMFTRSDRGIDELVIEAAFGLGEVVVSGSVEPDTYRVDRASGRVRDTHVGRKLVALVTDARGQHSEDLPPDRAFARVLTDEEVKRLAGLGLEIEAHYGAAQDIEWTFVGDEISIVQSRPITFANHSEGGTRVVLRGLGVGPGRATGRVRILQSPKQGMNLDGAVRQVPRGPGVAVVADGPLRRLAVGWRWVRDVLRVYRR